jgi:carbon monoxide dehydrogenase subunit G
MIHFEGDRTFRKPVAEVSARLGDAAFLVGCLPDVQVTEATPARAVWKMRPGFSFVRTTLDTTLEVVEHIPETSTRYRLTSSGIGASSAVEVALTYRAQDGGTAVHWAADITQLTGLLKVVPKGLLQSAAGKVIDETWTAVEKGMTGA